MLKTKLKSTSTAKPGKTSAELPVEGDLEDVVIAGVLSVSIYWLVKFFKKLFGRNKS